MYERGNLIYKMKTYILNIYYDDFEVKSIILTGNTEIK